MTNPETISTTYYGVSV